MTVWTVLTVLAEGAAAAVFLILGSVGRHRILMSAGCALIVALTVMVGSTLWHKDGLASAGFLLGFTACLVGVHAIATRVKPGNRRR